MFARGQHVVLFGLVEMRGHGGLQLTNPQYEILDDEDGETIHTGRIVPVYERAGSVTPKMQRRLVYDVLQHLPADLPDLLPEAVRLRLNLPTRQAALLGAHFPAADLPVAQLNRLRHAGAARPDLRGGVPVSDGPAGAAARRGGRSKSRRRSPSTIGSARRRGRCCRSS